MGKYVYVTKYHPIDAEEDDTLYGVFTSRERAERELKAQMSAILDRVEDQQRFKKLKSGGYRHERKYDEDWAYEGYLRIAKYPLNVSNFPVDGKYYREEDSK